MGNLLAAIFLEAAWLDFCAMLGLDPLCAESRRSALGALLRSGPILRKRTREEIEREMGTLPGYMRNKRVSAGMSLRDLAEAIGVAVVDLSGWERGRVMVPPCAVDLIAKAVPGASVEEMRRLAGGRS